MWTNAIHYSEVSHTAEDPYRLDQEANRVLQGPDMIEVQRVAGQDLLVDGHGLVRVLTVWQQTMGEAWWSWVVYRYEREWERPIEGAPPGCVVRRCHWDRQVDSRRRLQEPVPEPTLDLTVHYVENGDALAPLVASCTQLDKRLLNGVHLRPRRGRRDWGSRTLWRMFPWGEIRLSFGVMQNQECEMDLQQVLDIISQLTQQKTQLDPMTVHAITGVYFPASR
jgi:hypothetical protein